jgi:hypothetical protein
MKTNATKRIATPAEVRRLEAIINARRLALLVPPLPPAVTMRLGARP